MIFRTYKRHPEALYFPFGMCGDVLICFQHYKSFDEAREAWNRRKARVNYEHLGIILLADEEFMQEAEQFDSLDRHKRLLFTISFDFKVENVDIAAIHNIPEGVHFMEYRSAFTKYYEENFDAVKWLNSL